MNQMNEMSKFDPEMTDLYFGMRNVLNSRGAEAVSMTGDDTLALFLIRCLAAWNEAIESRDERYSNATREIIAAELGLAAKLRPLDEHWLEAMGQARRIVEIGLGAYVTENRPNADLGQLMPIPQADYGAVWGELRGYIEEAAGEPGSEDGDSLAAHLLVYMDELKERAMAPAKAWLRGAGFPPAETTNCA